MNKVQPREQLCVFFSVEMCVSCRNCNQDDSEASKLVTLNFATRQTSIVTLSHFDTAVVQTAATSKKQMHQKNKQKWTTKQKGLV